MILGLPISGDPVTGPVVSAGWRARVEQWLGIEVPPPPEEGPRGRCSGVLISWLRANFRICPPDADEATVTFHCRAWVLHMFGCVLFPDGTGDTASWMYIHCLQDWDDAGRYSWGSAVLGFLYRQLCEACRRTARSSTFGGCAYLLQIWMWMRLPVGRPRVFPVRAWVPQDYPLLHPPVGFLYDVVSGPSTTSARAYLDYSNEIDALSPSSVCTTFFSGID